MVRTLLAQTARVSQLRNACTPSTRGLIFGSAVAEFLTNGPRNDREREVKLDLTKIDGSCHEQNLA